MRISDWSSDVCSSDLRASAGGGAARLESLDPYPRRLLQDDAQSRHRLVLQDRALRRTGRAQHRLAARPRARRVEFHQRADLYPRPTRGLRPLAPARQCRLRSEEHTSELQSLMRISYAVFCLTKNKPEHISQY